jgi:hypothetical protein
MCRSVKSAATVLKADPALAAEVINGHVSVAAAEKKARARKAPAYTGPLMPGQGIRIEKSKPAQTRESRILAAINSGNGLVAAAEEVAEAEELGFSGEHLAALIDQVRTEIEVRKQMLRALMAHTQTKGTKS